MNGSNPSLPPQPKGLQVGGAGTDVAADPIVVPSAFKAGKALTGELMKLCGPPNVPISISLYRVCCAASSPGIVSAANNVIAIAKINGLDFIHSPLLRLLAAGVRFPVW